MNGGHLTLISKGAAATAERAIAKNKSKDSCVYHTSYQNAKDDSKDFLKRSNGSEVFVEQWKVAGSWWARVSYNGQAVYMNERHLELAPAGPSIYGVSSPTGPAASSSSCSVAASAACPAVVNPTDGMIAVCLQPGCGKGTWNGQPGEHCGRACKKVADAAERVRAKAPPGSLMCVRPGCDRSVDEEWKLLFGGLQ